MFDFHYVSPLGAIFSIFVGWYYWFQITGYMHSETLETLRFWLTFIGVALAFFPMHFLGLSRIARAITNYPDAFAGINERSSIVAYFRRRLDRLQVSPMPLFAR